MNIVSQAPVLLIPDALDAATCRRLIDVFETKGSVETGVEYSFDGHRVDGLDPDAKRLTERFRRSVADLWCRRGDLNPHAR